MRTLLLSPHADDETLFAAWTVIEHKPEVIVVLGDPHDETRKHREAETVRALYELVERPTVMFLPQFEGAANEVWITRRLRLLDEGADLDGAPIERVFAPAFERHGHDEHNLVANIALDVFGADRVTRYLTYTRPGGRSQRGTEVPFEPEWITRKLRALACYMTQHEHPQRRPWFVDLIDLREFYA